MGSQTDTWTLLHWYTKAPSHAWFALIHKQLSGKHKDVSVLMEVPVFYLKYAGIGDMLRCSEPECIDVCWPSTVAQAVYNHTDYQRWSAKHLINNIPIETTAQRSRKTPKAQNKQGKEKTKS